jgi:hypothetical protein
MGLWFLVVLPGTVVPFRTYPSGVLFYNLQVWEQPLDDHN